MRTGIFFPPLVVRQIEKLNLELVHYHTPSPVGLLGAFIANRHNLPLVTTYHTDMYQYVSHYPALFPGVLALTLVAPLAVGNNAEDFEAALSLMKPERKLEDWNKKIVRRMTTVVHNRCDLIIAPSHKIEKQLLSWGTKSRIEVLPTGVDELKAEPGAAQALRKNYQMEEADIILFVGRLGGEKNIELLIESLPYLLTKRPQAQLLIVGDDAHRAALQKLARGLGLKDKVKFTGYLDRGELAPAYAAADVFAFPSRTDTQGLVLHEAAWAGLPIVMTDPLITEVVKPNENGLISRNDPRHFSSALATILQNQALRREMGVNSRRFAAQYSASKQASKLLRLYEEVSAHEQRTDPKI